MDEEPRQLTTEEVRQNFLDHVRGIVQYWSNVQKSGKPAAECISGVVHSILATIDGCSADMPGFSLIPMPHQDDEEYHRKEGENWYPRGPESDFDIGGGLHELFYKTH